MGVTVMVDTTSVSVMANVFGISDNVGILGVSVGNGVAVGSVVGLIGRTSDSGAS